MLRFEAAQQAQRLRFARRQGIGVHAKVLHYFAQLHVRKGDCNREMAKPEKTETKAVKLNHGCFNSDASQSSKLPSGRYRRTMIGICCSHCRRGEGGKITRRVWRGASDAIVVSTCGAHHASECAVAQASPHHNRTRGTAKCEAAVRTLFCFSSSSAISSGSIMVPFGTISGALRLRQGGGSGKWAIAFARAGGHAKCEQEHRLLSTRTSSENCRAWATHPTKMGYKTHTRVERT